MLVSYGMMVSCGRCPDSTISAKRACCKSNFYAFLGLAVGAKPEDVKAAFHKLAKSSHPDINVNDSTAEERFKEVNQAYEILSDSEKRAAYDLGLKHDRHEPVVGGERTSGSRSSDPDPTQTARVRERDDSRTLPQKKVQPDYALT